MGMLDDGRGFNKWNNKSTYEKGHFTVVKNEIAVETVQNSWRHGEYSWFPNEENDNSNEG